MNKTTKKKAVRKKAASVTPKAAAPEAVEKSVAQQAYADFVTKSKEYEAKAQELGHSAVSSVFPPQQKVPTGNKASSPMKGFMQFPGFPQQQKTDQGTQSQPQNYTNQVSGIANAFGSAIKMGVDLLNVGLSTGVQAMGGLQSMGGFPPQQQPYPQAPFHGQEHAGHAGHPSPHHNYPPEYNDNNCSDYHAPQHPPSHHGCNCGCQDQHHGHYSPDYHNHPGSVHGPQYNHASHDSGHYSGPHHGGHSSVRS